MIRWDGARQPTIKTVLPPEVDPGEARLELVRRFLHIFGPATPEAFAEWSAIPAKRAHAAFDALGESLTPVRTPIGDAWILTRDEPTFAVPSGSVAPARLLPSGDTYCLLLGAHRELLVATPIVAASCGHRACGPAPSWLRARSSGCGGARRRRWRCKPGGASRERHATRSRPKQRPCRFRVSRGRSSSAGADPDQPGRARSNSNQRARSLSSRRIAAAAVLVNGSSSWTASTRSMPEPRSAVASTLPISRSRCRIGSA